MHTRPAAPGQGSRGAIPSPSLWVHWHSWPPTKRAQHLAGLGGHHQRLLITWLSRDPAGVINLRHFHFASTNTSFSYTIEFEFMCSYRMNGHTKTIHPIIVTWWSRDCHRTQQEWILSSLGFFKLAPTYLPIQSTTYSCMQSWKLILVQSQILRKTVQVPSMQNWYSHVREHISI